MQIIPPQLYDKAWKLDLALAVMAAVAFWILYKLGRAFGLIKKRI
jgi:hypothetical protein